MRKNRVEFYIRIIDSQNYKYDFDLVADYNVHQICSNFDVDSFIFESKSVEDKLVKQSLMVRIIPKETDETILDAVISHINNSYFLDEIAENHFNYFLEKYGYDEDTKKLINSNN